MGVVARLGGFLNGVARRWVPDPFVLALLLTAIVMAAGLALTGGDILRVLAGWKTGVIAPAGLAFALEMCLILVTGHALALSPPVQRGIAVVARLPRSAPAATVLVAVVACGTALIHWGLGAVAGALLAREVARHAGPRGLRVHYPLLGAAAYSGFAVWHGGLSGSAPLDAAKGAGSITAGTLAASVPLSETLFSPMNLVITPALVLLFAALFWYLTPARPDDADVIDASRMPPLPVRERRTPLSWIQWLQESAAPGTVIGLGGVLLLVAAFASGRMKMDLDAVVLLFLFLSMALHGSLRHYVAAIDDGARGAGGIILQFPFYFGIAGIMKATGLVDWISDGLIGLSTAATFPLVTFWSAGLVNLAIPSGGGQWAVQGDFLLSAGSALGVAPGKTVMAFALGDEWTNTLQPFWAIPILGIMGLEARQIIGYTAVLCIAMGAAASALLLLLG